MSESKKEASKPVKNTLVFIKDYKGLGGDYKVNDEINATESVRNLLVDVEKVAKAKKGE